MERKRITCPETAHLEEIDFERTPFGIVLGGCSRFEPRSCVGCAGECARRLDTRARRDSDPSGERVLVVHAGARSEEIARALGFALGVDGLVVDLADAATRGAPPPADYDAVVMSSPLRFGRHARAIVDYVSRHREELADMPAYLVAVSRRRDAQPLRMWRRTRWRPTAATTIAPDAATDAPRVRAIARAIADDIPGAWA